MSVLPLRIRINSIQLQIHYCWGLLRHEEGQTVTLANPSLLLVTPTGRVVARDSREELRCGGAPRSPVRAGATRARLHAVETGPAGVRG